MILLKTYIFLKEIKFYPKAQLLRVHFYKIYNESTQTTFVQLKIKNEKKKYIFYHHEVI